MEQANHSFAVRVYGGKLTITEVQAEGSRPYQLLNLPYYLISQFDHYLSLFVKGNLLLN